MSKKITYILQTIFLPSFLINIFLSIKYKCFIHPSAKIYWPNNLKLAKGVRIGKGSIIMAYGKTVLEKNSALEEYCIINNKNGEILMEEESTLNSFSMIQSTSGNTIHIGKNVAIAPYVRIVPNHKYNGIRIDGTIKGSTNIGDNVWIGAGVTIIIGTNINNNSIIGANSVVTKDVPENTVVAGNPAKFIETLQEYVKKNS